MKHFTADDGRNLTPPTELEPLLKDAYTAFIKLLGHIRFFYMADEIWDGKSSLVFNNGNQRLLSIALDDGFSHIHIADKVFEVFGESMLDNVFEVLNKNSPDDCHRPSEQLSVNPDPAVFPCGYRCDLCLGSKKYDDNNLSQSDNFAYMNWVCYHGCVPGIDIERPPADEIGVFRCSGCNQSNNKFCRCIACSKEKGYANCAECGNYHSCGVYRDSHYAGQCNLGITAEEVTALVIPYCMKERLDYFRSQLIEGRC